MTRQPMRHARDQGLVDIKRAPLIERPFPPFQIEPLDPSALRLERLADLFAARLQFLKRAGMAFLDLGGWPLQWRAIGRTPCGLQRIRIRDRKHRGSGTDGNLDAAIRRKP
jgi:hypothetical protein